MSLETMHMNKSTLDIFTLTDKVGLAATSHVVSILIFLTQEKVTPNIPKNFSLITLFSYTA